MKKFNTIICTAAALLLTSCAAPSAADNSEREVGGVSSETETPPVSSDEDTAELETSVPESAPQTEEIETVDPENAPPTVETTAEPEWIRERPDFFSNRSIQIDMNYDGVPEDFFLLDDGYEMVLYDTFDGMDYHSFTLPRVDNIDIYRRSADYPGNYTYGFSCVYGKNKSVLFYMVYTGCEACKFIGGTGYGQYLSPNISYHEYNGSMLQEDFNKLMSDPHYFLKECREPGWEYVRTLNLEELTNNGCTQRYLQSIMINDDIGEIKIFSLENDVFGKEIRLMNEKYSVYISDFENIELYERNATMEVPTKSYHVYDYVPRGELDYLLCFMSDSGAECVYLGTADERYLFPYNFSAEEGFTEISAEELEKDDWIFSRKVELP